MKKTVKLTEEQAKKLKERNEAIEKIEKKTQEIEDAGGIVADKHDLYMIYGFNFTIKMVDFFGKMFVGIVNLMNKAFDRKRRKFWDYVFDRYYLPKGIPMNIVKVDGQYKFVIQRENGQK